MCQLYRSGVAESPGGDEAEADQQGEQQELLHERSAYRAAAQTVRRSRAPVSEDGWRNFDMARASI
jgi:hypothetical protein